MVCFEVEVGQTELLLPLSTKEGGRGILVAKGVLISNEIIHYLLLLDMKV